MMLIDADTVHTGLGGMDQFVQRPVVILTDFLGVAQFRPGRIDPDRVVFLLKIIRQIPVGHQVKHGYFHTWPPLCGQFQLKYQL